MPAFPAFFSPSLQLVRLAVILQSACVQLHLSCSDSSLNVTDESPEYIVHSPYFQCMVQVDEQSKILRKGMLGTTHATSQTLQRQARSDFVLTQ